MREGQREGLAAIGLLLMVETLLWMPVEGPTAPLFIVAAFFFALWSCHHLRAP